MITKIRDFAITVRKLMHERYIETLKMFPDMDDNNHQIRLLISDDEIKLQLGCIDASAMSLLISELAKNCIRSSYTKGSTRGSGTLCIYDYRAYQQLFCSSIMSLSELKTTLGHDQPIHDETGYSTLLATAGIKDPLRDVYAVYGRGGRMLVFLVKDLGKNKSQNKITMINTQRLVTTFVQRKDGSVEIDQFCPDELSNASIHQRVCDAYTLNLSYATLAYIFNVGTSTIRRHIRGK